VGSDVSEAVTGENVTGGGVGTGATVVFGIKQSRFVYLHLPFLSSQSSLTDRKKHWPLKFPLVTRINALHLSFCCKHFSSHSFSVPGNFRKTSFVWLSPSERQFVEEYLTKAPDELEITTSRSKCSKVKRRVIEDECFQ